MYKKNMNKTSFHKRSTIPAYFLIFISVGVMSLIRFIGPDTSLWGHILCLLGSGLAIWGFIWLGLVEKYNNESGWVFTLLRAIIIFLALVAGLATAFGLI